MELELGHFSPSGRKGSESKGMFDFPLNGTNKLMHMVSKTERFASITMQNETYHNMLFPPRLG